MILGIADNLDASAILGDRIAFLKNGRFAFVGSPAEARVSAVPELRAFLNAEEHE